ncbi:cholecystokinin receptor type A-like [Physella acuta]|uniref:cholecystokinin receptor type A-like n=1 Tax=Physella acuta TaxID=109671 RepID=UPI0027DAEF2F|nr:cholecystokinin receptor type A-like [Physella acuta]
MSLNNNVEDGDTANSSHSANAPEPLVSPEVFNYFMTAVMDVVCSLIATFGIVSNVINIVVYGRQGVRESVNITFIALSLWDLCNCMLCLATVVCFIINDHFPSAEVDVLAVQYVYIGYTRGCTYALSTLVTVYLSIERCICIIFPFKVKDIFTRARSLCTNLGILLFGVACFSPAWASQGLQWQREATLNVSRLVLWVSTSRRQVDLFVDTFNGVVLPTVAQVVITVTSVIMISGVRASSQFRARAPKGKDSGSSTMGSVVGGPGSSTRAVGGPAPRQGPQRTVAGPTEQTLPNKDGKVAKVVVLVAVIFFMCNLPVLLVAYTRPFVPDMDVGKAYYSLYLMVYTVVYVSGLVNASVNIFVYYFVSSKFRSTFMDTFCSWGPFCRR